jgi:hypothetical protein
VVRHSGLTRARLLTCLPFSLLLAASLQTNPELVSHRSVTKSAMATSGSTTSAGRTLSAMDQCAAIFESSASDILDPVDPNRRVLLGMAAYLRACCSRSLRAHESLRCLTDEQAATLQAAQVAAARAQMSLGIRYPIFLLVDSQLPADDGTRVEVTPIFSPYFASPATSFTAGNSRAIVSHLQTPAAGDASTFSGLGEIAPAGAASVMRDSNAGHSAALVMQRTLLIMSSALGYARISVRLQSVQLWLQSCAKSQRPSMQIAQLPPMRRQSHGDGPFPTWYTGELRRFDPSVDSLCCVFACQKSDI